MAGGASFVIFRASQKKDAAWKLIEFLSEPGIYVPGRLYRPTRDNGDCILYTAGNVTTFVLEVDDDLGGSAAKENSDPSHEFADGLADAGLPPGVLNVLPADRGTGEHLVGDPGVDKVAFTGSTVAGRTILRCFIDSQSQTTLPQGPAVGEAAAPPPALPAPGPLPPIARPFTVL